jgi:phospholipase/carboxylesterase
MLECIEKFTRFDKSYEYVIIWLHGLGADNTDFVPLVPQLTVNKAIKFVFPNAPIRPVTINNGYRMRAWYDISRLDSLTSGIDYAGIDASVKLINELISNQIASGTLSSKIIIAGFSQGAVISHATMLATEYKLAGVLALSGYLPYTEIQLKQKNFCHNKNTPILACHGTIDDIVPVFAGRAAYELLVHNGYSITWKEYNMGHTLCLEQITDITNWLNQVIITS